MSPEHLRYLACPRCKGDLRFVATESVPDGRIESGTIECSACSTSYPITAFIPRFVPPHNYAESFGLEWRIHGRTQYDSYTGVNISETRFFDETKWPVRLEGDTILEVGSGSGRFTEQAARTGATVVSLEYSAAVEANYWSNGTKPNVLIVQGDLFNMPFRNACFDKLFCFGVLQHTPDAQRAFMALAPYLRVGGDIAIDIYHKPGLLKRLLMGKYWVRPITRRMRPTTLYRFVRSYVTAMWPIAQWIHRIPRVGKKLNWALLVADFRDVFPLSEELLKEWAILDTFDMLSPAYDFPQSLETVQQWFERAGFEACEVHYGYNGIEGRGRKV
jgi:SAM-dependent methyltransferase